MTDLELDPEFRRDMDALLGFLAADDAPSDDAEALAADAVTERAGWRDEAEHHHAVADDQAARDAYQDRDEARADVDLLVEALRDVQDAHAQCCASLALARGRRA